MRVMLSCPYSLTLFGGVQGQVLGLARALRESGVDARIVAPCDGPPPEPGITTVGPSARVPSNGSVAPIASGRAVARRTIEALRTFRPDVLHLHEPLSPGPNHAALVGTTIPAVGTFHSSRTGRNGWYETFRPGLKPMMRRLAVATAVSEDAKRQVSLTFETDCEILPNGVDVPALASGRITPSTAPAIVFVGRHERRKGLEVLLDAFAGLERDADLWVIGDGPEQASLRARGVERVHWLGRVPEEEKQARLRGATIACFPALEGESFGVVLLEAMAAGTALVASDIDGYRTVSRADREALLVPAGDVDGFRRALRALLDDPARRGRLVAAGARRADEFSMAHLAERFLPLYERAILAPRPATV
ncbi:MAG TPA: glycosyltransferase family 4 protein [Acidimicrobiia bacterium]